jgi:hypothetical protein
VVVLDRDLDSDPIDDDIEVAILGHFRQWLVGLLKVRIQPFYGGGISYTRKSMENV